MESHMDTTNPSYSLDQKCRYMPSIVLSSTGTTTLIKYNSVHFFVHNTWMGSSWSGFQNDENGSGRKCSTTQSIDSDSESPTKNKVIVFENVGYYSWRKCHGAGSVVLHKRMVRSSEQDARSPGRRWFQATELTGPLWPWTTSTNSPLLRSHMYTSQSAAMRVGMVRNQVMDSLEIHWSILYIYPHCHWLRSLRQHHQVLNEQYSGLAWGRRTCERFASHRGPKGESPVKVGSIKMSKHMFWKTDEPTAGFDRLTSANLPSRESEKEVEGRDSLKLYIVR